MCLVGFRTGLERVPRLMASSSFHMELHGPISDDCYELLPVPKYSGWAPGDRDNLTEGVGDLSVIQRFSMIGNFLRIHTFTFSVFLHF